MKVCGKCKQEKELDKFSKSSGKRDGLQRWCKECWNAYYKENYYNQGKEKDRLYRKNLEIRKEKQDLIKQAKDKPCADCGVLYPSYVMDFDHLGDKDFTIAAYSRWSIVRMKKEIAKCEVVCANCHRQRTHSRLNNA